MSRLVQRALILPSTFTTTSASLVTVPNLQAAVLAGESWWFEYNLSGECSGVGGTQVAILLPAGSTLEAEIVGLGNNANTTSTNRLNVSGTASVTKFWAIAATFGPIWIRGTAVMTAGGLIQLQAQSGTAGQTSTINKGSYMRAGMMS